MGRGRKHEQGIYTLTYADGRTEDREGFDNAGMLDFARKAGAVRMTGPDGHVWDDGDIAISALSGGTPGTGTFASELDAEIYG
jgi:hypothetical protein